MKAPPIDIAHWMTDGEGKYPHITEFEKGKVYLIEFWATWCGPCKGIMPELAELQEKYGPEGFQAISISDEKPTVVQKFLESQQSPERTYGDIVKAYCLACDPDNSVYKDYYEASNGDGIPHGILIGKTGEVEWIGHPGYVAEVLADVMSDNWSREKALKIANTAKKRKAFSDEIRDLIISGDSLGVVKKYEKLFTDDDSDLKTVKLALLNVQPYLEDAHCKPETYIGWYKNSFEKFGDDPDDGPYFAFLYAGKLNENSQSKRALEILEPIYNGKTAADKLNRGLLTYTATLNNCGKAQKALELLDARTASPDLAPYERFELAEAKFESLINLNRMDEALLWGEEQLKRHVTKNPDDEFSAATSFGTFIRRAAEEEIPGVEKFAERMLTVFEQMDDGYSINGGCWAICEGAERGIEFSNEILEKYLALTKQAVEKLEGSPGNMLADALDTQAQLAKLLGDYDQAIELSKDALQQAKRPETKEHIRRTLRSLEKAKRAAK